MRSQFFMGNKMGYKCNMSVISPKRNQKKTHRVSRKGKSTTAIFDFAVTRKLSTHRLYLWCHATGVYKPTKHTKMPSWAMVCFVSSLDTSPLHIVSSYNFGTFHYLRTYLFHSLKLDLYLYMAKLQEYQIWTWCTPGRQYVVNNNKGKRLTHLPRDKMAAILADDIFRRNFVSEKIVL